MLAHRKSINGYTGSKGVTLVEVLIALVVLSIGVLGAAALQLESLKAAHYSYQVTVANLIAKDIKEKLWTFHAVTDVSATDGTNTETFFMACPIPVAKDEDFEYDVDGDSSVDWTVAWGTGYFLQEWSEMPGISAVGVGSANDGSDGYWKLNGSFDNMNKLPPEATVRIQPQAETSSSLPEGKCLTESFRA